MELPGCSRDGVQIDYADQVITVRGTRPAELCCPERYQQLERGQGPFSRSFRFALPIAGEAVVADLKDGVLTIVVPKLGDRRRIEIG
jgi:HSP20 family protein